MTFLRKSVLASYAFLLGAPAAVQGTPVEIIPAEMRGAAQPQIAATPSGRVHVTFGNGNSIYHTASLDGGRTFAPPVKVGELPKLALGLRRGPRIAAADGAVVIGAISAEDGNLHAWVSKDGGTTWKGGVEINDRPKSAREGLHAMAGDGRGDVLAVWLDDRSGRKELWRATSKDGGATWGDNALVYKSPEGTICECCHPSAAMDGEGRAAVMWRNWLGGSRDMYTAVSANRGESFGPAQKLGSGAWKLTGCPMDGGGLALDAAGKPLTAWRREGALFATVVGGAEETLAASGTQPVIVNGTGGVYELWESGGGLMLRRGNGDPSRLAEKARFAAAAALPTKGAVVVWESQAQGTQTLLAETLE